MDPIRAANRSLARDRRSVLVVPRRGCGPERSPLEITLSSEPSDRQAVARAAGSQPCCAHGRELVTTLAVRALVARRLEKGSSSLAARAAAVLWGRMAARGIARPLRLPAETRVIGVGSAVLGGAGKTPLAIALSRALAARGDRVALIGHAYRADPERPRVVAIDDPVALVGDDALASTRLLAGASIPVIVAPDRQRAIDHAAALGFRVLVVDGLLQASPTRLAASILVLDASAPWGGGACPPAGDLRAPREALLAAADHVVALGSGEPAGSCPPNTIAIHSRIEGAIDAQGRRWSLADLALRRVGLFVAIARPARIEAALREAGVDPRPVVALADHAVPTSRDLARAARSPVDAWLTTARCAVKLPAAIGGAPVLVLQHAIDVAPLAARLSLD
ncbi:MAG: tetraacyldisaccharide 4'-kinase [Byssovorax sp.]